MVGDVWPPLRLTSRGMIAAAAGRPKPAAAWGALSGDPRIHYIYRLSWLRVGATANDHEGTAVKTNIHPVYQTITATCQCGNTFETRSTKEGISVEVCAKCHPYYTGKQRLVDTAGRIDRFRRKYGSSDAPAAS